MGRVFAVGVHGTGQSQEIAGALALAIIVAVISTAQAQTGSITGVVTATAKTLAPVRVTIDQKVCGNELPDEAIVIDAQGHLAFAIVTLAGVKAKPGAAETVVTNEKCHFGPRVQIARPNSNVRTTSKDPILHTTNASTENGRTLFNVALPLPGINIVKPIGAAGVVRLSCNTHPWMRGWVLVTDEVAAVTGADGRFTLPDVPPGSYELRIWHEALKSAPQKVTVVAGKPTEVAFQLK
jgi:hypothetical protein